MKISSQLLRNLEACPDQVKLFSKLYPNGVSYTTQTGLQRLVNKANKQGLDVEWFIVIMKLSCVLRGYYENGQLEYEDNYKDGERDGTWRGYYKNGHLRNESNYKRNKRDGVGRGYYDNGQLRYEWKYKDGKIDGVWRYYYADGQLECEGNYKDSKLVKEIQ